MSYRLHPTKNKKIPADSPRKWYQFEILVPGEKTKTGTRKKDTHVFMLTPGGAERMHLELMRQQGKQETPRKVSPTFNEALPDFLAWYKLDVGDGTIDDFVRVLKHLKPHFGTLKFPAIPSVVQAYKEMRLRATYIPGRPAQMSEDDTPADRKKRKSITRKTINRELSYLRSVVKWAEDDDHQYCESGTRHKIALFPKKKITTPMQITHSQDEIEDILDEIGNLDPYFLNLPEGHHQRVFAEDRRGLSLLMYDAGLRKKEARLLESERVDLPPEPEGDPPYYGKIIITRKGGKIQILPILTRRLYEELLRRKKTVRRGLLFRNPLTKEAYIDIRGGLIAAAKRAGSVKRITHHLLRHDFVSHLHEEGADLKTIQELAGHADLQTTMRIYAHVQTDTLRRKASAFTEKKNRTPSERKSGKKK